MVLIMAKISWLRQWIVLVILTECRIVLTTSCKKLDECSCELSDGSGIVSLQEVDGGKNGPRYVLQLFIFISAHSLMLITSSRPNTLVAITTFPL